MRSHPALIGEVDIFVSHSWHDDVQAKWDALHSWCKRFEATHGRPPKLWLDFCCIDQANIETNLRCLPVYLSGCRKLLIIAGATYVQRLWCAIELFVFVSIHKITGGKLEMSIIGPTESCRSSVRESLLSFDATKCKCCESTDKSRLLGIIEAVSGTMDRFNRQIREILADLQMERGEPEDVEATQSMSGTLSLRGFLPMSRCSSSSSSRTSMDSSTSTTSPRLSLSMSTNPVNFLHFASKQHNGL